MGTELEGKQIEKGRKKKEECAKVACQASENEEFDYEIDETTFVDV